MINASISEDGNIVLSAFGHDSDKLKEFKGTFEVVPVGSNINPKTGRKHFIIKLVAVPEFAETVDEKVTPVAPSQPKKKRTAKEEVEFKEQVGKSYPKPEASDMFFDSKATE
jgi:hypothetical protein